VQATNDGEMLERMLEYLVNDYKIHKKAPLQYVLYIGNAPMKMKNTLNEADINYSYRLIDIRDLDPVFFLGVSDWRFWTLAYLTARDVSERRALLQLILRRLDAAGLSDIQWTEAISMLTGLAPLRNAEELVENTIKELEMELELKYDVRKAPFYKDGFKEGAAEKQTEMIRNFAKNGVSIEIIAKTTNLDVETVKKIING
jgi:hypothetical protein